MLKRFLVTKIYVVEAQDGEEAITLSDSIGVEQSSDAEEINDDMIGHG